jgi:hypothetical protein
MTDSFSRWQPTHFPLTFVSCLAAALAQYGFLLRNCDAVSAQQFAAGRGRFTGHNAKHA